MRDRRRLVLLRHGRTEWNATDRYQGQSDVDLDDDPQGPEVRRLLLRADLTALNPGPPRPDRPWGRFLDYFGRRPGHRLRLRRRRLLHRAARPASVGRLMEPFREDWPR